MLSGIRFRQWAAVSLVVLCTVLNGVAARADDASRVLVLYTNGRLVAGNVEVERGLSSALPVYRSGLPTSSTSSWTFPNSPGTLTNST
jgi:hypothetical protein